MAFDMGEDSVVIRGTTVGRCSTIRIDVPISEFAETRAPCPVGREGNSL